MFCEHMQIKMKSKIQTNVLIFLQKATRQIFFFYSVQPSPSQVFSSKDYRYNRMLSCPDGNWKNTQVILSTPFHGFSNSSWFILTPYVSICIVVFISKHFYIHYFIWLHLFTIRIAIAFWMSSIKFRILGGTQNEIHCSFRCYMVWVAHIHKWPAGWSPFIALIFCMSLKNWNCNLRGIVHKFRRVPQNIFQALFAPRFLA